MKFLLIAASVVALTSPAFAQSTGSSSAKPAASGGIATPPADTAMPASSAAPAQEASAAPASAPASDPKAIIASEFPTYDKDASGALSRTEFDTWLVALKEKSGDTAMKPADKTSWLKTAFTTADKDKDKGVSLAELTEYLTAAS
jgi:hypothetical protein